MGWVGALRLLAAEARRAEREAQRHRRELLKQQKQMERMEALRRAEYEVELYEAHINALLSVHKECSEVWNWQKIKDIAPPPKPVYSDEDEITARRKLEQYSPSFFDKVLKRAEAKRNALTKAIEYAKVEDTKRYQEAVQQYEKDLAEWQNLQKIANGVLANEPSAYIAAIRETDPFADIRELGSSTIFRTNDARYIESILDVNSEQVIPSEVKTLLKSGKLSIKEMPKGQFYELYQDYVCSCVLRMARELFALLPIQMIFVHAVSELLNLQTGYKEQKPILSVAIPRTTIIELNFETIDCSDSMRNFVHRMKFGKTKGFSSVEMLKPQGFMLDTAGKVS